MQDKILKLRDLLVSTGLQEESGSIIYSGDSTLKKGLFYFLGTNPGENSLNYPDTILNQVMLSKEKNEYFEGNWGNSTHQETIKRMFKTLDINLKDTFSTNTSFIRSPGEQKYQPRYPINELSIKKESKAMKQLKKDGRETFWPIQEYFLSIVKPKLVIANGSIARDLFWKKIKGKEFKDSKIEKENKFEYPKQLRGRKLCHFFKGNLKTKDIFLENLMVISLPHLSFQDYAFHEQGINWVKKIIKNNL